MKLSELLMWVATLAMHTMLIYWAFCCHWSAGVFVFAFIVFAMTRYWMKTSA